LFIIFVQEFRNMADQTLYEELGEENLQKLVDGFYDLVFINPRISRLFKTDKDLIKEKQRLFLTQFLGGPSLYSENMDTRACVLAICLILLKKKMLLNG
jgi:truncated hemoglobin YjbI